MNHHWVGAGHLNIGDVIKRANGFGMVKSVNTSNQTEIMYNLTVDKAHTYYVGNKGWLVHNCSIWTSTTGKTSVENAFDHWKKHGADFPELQNAKQYVEAAQNFVKNPPTGTLTYIRPNGDVLFYNPNTNIFVVTNSIGETRTMFKPNQGMDYWLRNTR